MTEVRQGGPIDSNSFLESKLTLEQALERVAIIKSAIKQVRQNADAFKADGLDRNNQFSTSDLAFVVGAYLDAGGMDVSNEEVLAVFASMQESA